jgi:hypothetical protein
LLARLDGNGKAIWLTTNEGVFRGPLLTDGATVFSLSSAMNFLRTYDLATGVLRTPEFFARGGQAEPAYLARTENGEIWITGTYHSVAVPKFYDPNASRPSTRIRLGTSEQFFWLRLDPG